MSKRVFKFSLITLLSIILLMGCSDSDSEDVIDLQIGSATQTGNFYPIGASLAQLWNDEVEGVNAASQATDGSAQNLNLMSEGKAKVGLTTMGDLYDAYNGEGQFKDNQYKDVRVITKLYSDAAQVVVRKGSEIDDVDDLKDHKYVPGAPGSGAKKLSEEVLSGYDMTFDDVNPQYVGFDEATDLMRNKQVVGAQVMSGIPTSAVIDMISSANGELISLSDEAIDNITNDYPWLEEFTIPADTYEGVDEDIKTVAQPSTIVVSKDVPDEVVYELTKVMWGNLDVLHDAVAATKNMDLDTAAQDLGDVPLHPGAEKFYEEEGVLDN